MDAAAVATSPGTGFEVTVRFADGEEQVVPVAPGQTLLAAAETRGVPILSECRNGICGACAGRCRGGDYELATAEGLSEEERAAGGVLACQMRVRSDCVVELDYSATDNAARQVCGDAVISALDIVSATTAVLSLDASGLGEILDYRPGQYARLRVPGTDEWRCYSYARLPNAANRLAFIIRLLPTGAMSDYVRNRARVGDTLQLRGSSGGFHLRPVRRPVVLMAGGTGLSAILAILAQLAQERVRQPVRVYYGVNAERDLCRLDELQELGAHLADFRLQVAVAEPAPGWGGATGLVTDLLEAPAMFGGDVDVYLCGPPAMVEASRRWFPAHGLQRAQIFYERFTASGAPPSPRRRLDPARLDHAQLERDGRGTAVVIGGSIAGICAARVLADRFDRVIVLEQDTGHCRDEGRPGAAQGWHLHHLLLAAQRALEKIFPGIGDEMVREGAFRVDMAHQYRILMAGSWKKVFHSGIEILCAGRPLIEWCLRRRLDAEPRIDYRYDSTVVELLHDRGANRVQGVAVACGDAVEIVPAEFVVDAAGKNTPVPRLLGELGIGMPAVEQDCINAVYSTLRHRVPPERRWRDKVMVICYAYRPFQKHYTAQYYTDSTRSVLSTSLVAYDCHEPPRTVAEFHALARKMPSPVVARELEGLEPCSEIHNFRYPSMLRRRYEQMDALPRGLVALGDAYCSADPVSGAGIAKALMELEELRRLLAQERPDSAGLVSTYYHRVSRISDRIWFVIREQNLRYPWLKDVDSKRPFYFGALTWYMDRLVELSHSSTAVYGRLLAVTHFVAPPASLMAPGLAARVVGKWLWTKLRLRRTLIERNFDGGSTVSAEDMPVEA